MRIFVDADGCPVVNITIDLAKEYDLEVIIVKNYAHEIEDDYATIITIDIGPDSADYYIVNNLNKGDIVVSQDYGFAAMAIAKGAICITQNGFIITSKNIDGLLATRHINQKLRREHNIYSKFKKRSSLADIEFEKSLRNLIISKLS